MFDNVNCKGVPDGVPSTLHGRNVLWSPRRLALKKPSKSQIAVMRNVERTTGFITAPLVTIRSWSSDFGKVIDRRIGRVRVAEQLFQFVNLANDFSILSTSCHFIKCSKVVRASWNDMSQESICSDKWPHASNSLRLGTGCQGAHAVLAGCESISTPYPAENT